MRIRLLTASTSLKTAPHSHMRIVGFATCIIIFKVLVNRWKQVLEKIISNSQNAFIFFISNQYIIKSIGRPKYTESIEEKLPS
jgi:hypothetical protein